MRASVTCRRGARSSGAGLASLGGGEEEQPRAVRGQASFEVGQDRDRVRPERPLVLIDHGQPNDVDPVRPVLHGAVPYGEACGDCGEAHENLAIAMNRFPWLRRISC